MSDPRAGTASPQHRPRSPKAGASVVAALAIVLGACGSQPPSTEPTPGDGAPLPETIPAVLLQAIVPHVGGPGGPELMDDFGENPSPLDPARRVLVLGEPVPGPDGRWFHVYVLPDATAYPGDFYAWLPEARQGRPVMRFEAAPACPPALTTEALAILTQPDRLRCAGAESLKLTGRSWQMGHYIAYAANPAWYGRPDDDDARVISLYEGPPGFPRPPNAGKPWLDVHLAPGVERPPYDFELEVTGQFDHPAATECQRIVDRAGMVPLPPAGSGLPDEAVEDSVRWCRERFVVTGWAATAGPEGRAVDPASPQLHRVPLPGPNSACGGVGMPPLLIRIDPTAMDPIWIEAGGARSIPFFGPDLELEFTPEPAIVAPDGRVLLRDGDVVDPDRGAGNLAVCPGGLVVTFQLVP